MDLRPAIRAVLTVAFIVALVTYHVTNLWLPQGIELLSVYKIVQIVILAAIAFLFVTNSRVASILCPLFGVRYIGGKYGGQSLKSAIAYPLQLEVRQNLFGAHIEAQSRDSMGSVVSNWTGTLFKNEGNKFYFGVTLDAKGISENGILDIALNEDGFAGFYRPAHHKAEEAYRVDVKRV
jgi:hypothetical protein